MRRMGRPLPSYQANDSKRAPGAKVFKKEDFGIAEDQFVYCNLNNVFKITESIFDSWLRILKSTENTVLLLFAENSQAVTNLKAHAISKGLDIKRLIFMERQTRADYLACYGIVDLFLTPTPTMPGQQPVMHSGWVYQYSLCRDHPFRVGLPQVY